jgi:hypothetical protein
MVDPGRSKARLISGGHWTPLDWPTSYQQHAASPGQAKDHPYGLLGSLAKLDQAYALSACKLP